MRAPQEPDADQVEMLPLTIVTQEFPARPSALPDVRDFVRRQLTSSPMSDDEVRTLCDRVAGVLLDAAGESEVLQVSLRIFPTGAEVDVVFSRDNGVLSRGRGVPAVSARDPGTPARDPGPSARDRDASARDRDTSARDRGTSARDRGTSARDRGTSARDRGTSARDRGASAGDLAEDVGARIESGPHPSDPPAAGAGPVSFARWFSASMRREGLTAEAAARQLNVSAKTVSRWVGGTTEPRLRDLYRIRQIFGEPPLQ